MYKRILINSFNADIKFIIRDPMLFIASLAPILIILLLKLVFPLASELIYAKTGFNPDTYYSVIAVTIIMVIPMLFGLVYAFILLDEIDSDILKVIDITPAGKKSFVLMRVLTPTFMSLLLLVISNYIVNPVPTEGWLRTIYISFLLSLQAPFVFLFIATLSKNKVEGFAHAKLYSIFLIAVPLGLMLYHPWNYLAFFSPLYWIAWSWVVASPAESFLYGIISLFLTICGMLLFLRKFLRKT